MRFLTVRRIPPVRLRALHGQDLISCLHPEITFFQNPVSVSSDESQVASLEYQLDSLRLTWLQLDLFECTESPVLRGEGGYQIAAEQHYSLFSCHGSGISHIHREYQLVIGSERFLVYLETAVAECGVAESESERPLYGNHCVVVVCPLHGIHLLAYTVVVVRQGCGMARIGVRHLRARIRIAGQNIGQCVPAIVSGQQDIYDTFCQRFYVVYQPRPATVENQYDRFPCTGELFYQIPLVF